MLIGAYLREELPVYIRLFIALRVRHTGLVDFPEQHFRKTLTYTPQRIFQRELADRFCLTERRFRALCLVQPLPVEAPHGAVRMCIHIALVDIDRNLRETLRTDLIGRPVKNNQVDRELRSLEKGGNRINRDAKRLRLRVAVNPGGNQREGHALTLVIRRKFQGFPVARAQFFLFPLHSALPARPDRVNHILAGKPIALGNLCLPRFAAVQLFTSLKELGPRRAVDAAVHPAPAEQGAVCGIHNGIHPHLRDIVSDQV